jgi:uncharacterized protein YgiM (DUF1202 family)
MVQPGETAQAGGEQVVVIQIGNDGWVQVRYPDGDVVWTPPGDVKSD